MLDFFMDPTRSGIYVTKSRYVSLAGKCLKYLANVSIVSNDSNLTVDHDAR